MLSASPDQAVAIFTSKGSDPIGINAVPMIAFDVPYFV